MRNQRIVKWKNDLMSNNLSLAASTLKKLYGMEGRIHALPGELDLNFDVETAAGRFVLKLMRSDCDPAFVELQIKAMECASGSGLEQFIPKVIRNKTGGAWQSVTDAEAKARIAWLISFLPGQVMAQVDPWTPRLAASIGETMARICRALDKFEHPLLDRKLNWDLRQGAWIADHLDAFSDDNRRRLIEKIAANFSNELSPILDALPRAPIHGDANDMNIFVHERGPHQGEVSGVIDFGDMARTPRVCEPAIAMAYAMMGEGDALARGAALAGGFHRILPLSDHETKLLLPLIRLRLAISVTNAAVQRAVHPENEYLSISEAPAWRLLEKLNALNDATTAEQFAAACANPQKPKTAHASAQSLAARRKKISPENLALSYEAPLDFVRGEKHFLFDRDGAQYLDAYNNVPHVGHANPVVVDAVRRQMSLINTNTRYLQDIHIEYAERMIGLLPDPLSKIMFLNSASEANEFALRISRAVTGARDMLVMDHGYHGNTTGAMDISPYKFHHPKGAGAAPDWVQVTSQPNIYGGRYRDDDASARYVEDVKTILANMKERGRPPAGFISECLPSVGGQIVLPDGYLSSVYAIVRDAGGVCIADDVQTALGRLGDFFWGFEQQGVIPDIAVFGKPIGNGFPLAAVAMTDEIADAFSAGPEFFSTFGGSSASCAAGNAVLDVLAADKLQQNAKNTGDGIHRALQEMANDHAIIGDVRGSGLFLGVDLVCDRKTRMPATAQANYIKNRLREEKILIGVEGPADNVLKIRPPMTFDEAAADQILNVLDKVFTEKPALP